MAIKNAIALIIAKSASGAATSERLPFGGRQPNVVYCLNDEEMAGQRLGQLLNSRTTRLHSMWSREVTLRKTHLLRCVSTVSTVIPQVSLALEAPMMSTDAFVAPEHGNMRRGSLGS